MNELLQKDQEMSVIPQDYRYSNKGKLIEFNDTYFVLKLQEKPDGISERAFVEFYSQTKHGTLFFESPIVKVDKDKIVVKNPNQHRFLQRRVFTRVKFIQEIELKLNDKSINATTMDIAAGGMKLKTWEELSLDYAYDITINLLGGSVITCKYMPVKMEKSDDGVYTSAGKFIDIDSNDQIKIIQYCLRKDVEYSRR